MVFFKLQNLLIIAFFDSINNILISNNNHKVFYNVNYTCHIPYIYVCMYNYSSYINLWRNYNTVTETHL